VQLKIAYLLMRWILGLAVLVFRGDQAKNAELLVLRHENTVLRRHTGRMRYEPGDQAWFTALTWFIPRRVESVNLYEAPLRGFYRVVASVFWGGLIQVLAEISGGSGGLVTKRSGWAM
jgi:putative transposase